MLPVRWTGPSLNPDSAKVAMETIELAHHGFLPGRGGQRVNKPIAPADPGHRQAGQAGGGAAPARRQNRVTMQKATLKLYAAEPAAGGSKTGAELGFLEFQFNPKEVTIAKTAKWERKPAKGSKTAGPPEFSGADPCKLTLEMFFDATSTQDGAVVTAVEQLFACTVPTEKSQVAKKPAPPLVVLHWGKVRSFAAFVTSVSAKYTLFSADGMPIRAVCSVALEEMPGEPFKQNPTSGGYDVRRTHRTISGDSLASIAYAEYGDPTAWRAAGRLQRRSTTRCACRSAPSCCCRRPRSCRPDEFFAACASSQIDGNDLPADVVPLLISAFVDDSQRLPDMFALRFRDPGRIVLAKSGAKVGAKAKIMVQVAGSPVARAADRRRDHRPGGGVRQRRDVHRDPRVRPGAPAVPRPAHRELRPDDGLRHRHQGGAARRPDGRRGDVDQHGVPAREPGRPDDWELLELLSRDNGFEVTVRDGKFSFAAPTTASRRSGRLRSEPSPQDPLVLELGRDLLRFRSVAHLGPAGHRGGGPRLGRRHEAGADLDRAGARPAAPTCRP